MGWFKVIKRTICFSQQHIQSEFKTVHWFGTPLFQMNEKLKMLS